MQVLNLPQSRMNMPFMTLTLYSCFLTLLLVFNCCTSKDSGISVKRTYLEPIDSVEFKGSEELMDYRYGKHIQSDSGQFIFSYINSEKRLCRFNIATGDLRMSNPICESELQAYLLDDSLIYLLYDNKLHIKDYQLREIESFPFKAPAIAREHGIDFETSNQSNLFRLQNRFALAYYVVEESGYRNTKYLFYYFNRDTAYFANKVCSHLDTSFQYFRYPVVGNGGEFLYHTSNVMNCLSKSTPLKTVLHKPIDDVDTNYLSFRHEDVFEISLLKEYRFGTHYNKDILCHKDRVYLLREFPARIYYDGKVKKYEHNLEVVQFDQSLKRLKSWIIKRPFYDYALISHDKLYLFSFYDKKYFVYKI